MYRCSLITNPLQVPRPVGFVIDVLLALSIKIKTVASLTFSTISLLRVLANTDDVINKLNASIKYFFC